MPHPTVRCAVRHPLTGSMIALDPGVDYADDDPFVQRYPWAFQPVENSHERIESVEVAQAEPGQKRTRTRK